MRNQKGKFSKSSLGIILIVVLLAGFGWQVCLADDASAGANEVNGAIGEVQVVVPVEAVVEDTSVTANELVIGSIETVGARSVTEVKILAKVRSREGQLFDAKTADEDAKRIAELSAVEKSYYNTKLVDGKIQLTFVIVEKNFVRKIEFVGRESVKKRTLETKVDLRVGDYLDRFKAETGREEIEQVYLKKGFAFVKVGLDATELSVGNVVYVISEGAKVKVKEISFNGNKAIKSSKLKKALKTKKKRYYFKQGYFVADVLDEDKVRLQKAYQTRGHLDAQISVLPKFNDEKDEVRIAVTIKEGPVYTVQAVSIKGNEFFENEAIEGKLKLSPGQIYNQKRAEYDIKKIVAMYREIGFIDVDVLPYRTFSAENMVTTRYDIAEGERFRVGKIDIKGNKETHDKVVRRILDEYDFQPGDWYNADAARGDGKGLLEKVVKQGTLTESTFIRPSGDKTGVRDSVVSVTEGQTGMIMLGAGVASDSGLIGHVVWEQRNFDIKDRPNSLYEMFTGKAFKGAGQTLRIDIAPGTELSQYSVNFTEPYFRDRPISMDVTGLSFERERESFDEERIKGYLGFEKRHKNKWRTSIGFRVEEVDVASVTTTAPLAIKNVAGGNFLGGIKLGFGKVDLDNKYNPAKGYVFSADYEQVFGDHNFGILSGTYRYYRTLHEDLAELKTVLATRLHAATVTSSSAPPFEKFYGGGMTSVRGFDYRGISTRGLQTNVATPARVDPIGSDWIMLANAEIIHPMTSENFALLFFVDTGAIDSGTIRASVGTGVQIMIPHWFGPTPMRFELATPISKENEDEEQVFSFSVARFF